MNTNEAKISYKVVAPNDITDYYVTDQPSATQLLRGIYYEEGITANQINETNLSDIEKFILFLATYEDARVDKETILAMIGRKKQLCANNPYYIVVLTKLEERINKKNSMLEKDYFLDYMTILEQLKDWRTQSQISSIGSSIRRA